MMIPKNFLHSKIRGLSIYHSQQLKQHDQHLLPRFHIFYDCKHLLYKIKTQVKHGMQLTQVQLYTIFQLIKLRFLEQYYSYHTYSIQYFFLVYFYISRNGLHKDRFYQIIDLRYILYIRKHEKVNHQNNHGYQSHLHSLQAVAKKKLCFFLFLKYSNGIPQLQLLKKTNMNHNCLDFSQVQPSPNHSINGYQEWMFISNQFLVLKYQLPYNFGAPSIFNEQIQQKLYQRNRQSLESMNGTMNYVLQQILNYYKTL